jgi:hypothetical protein
VGKLVNLQTLAFAVTGLSGGSEEKYGSYPLRVITPFFRQEIRDIFLQF